MTDGFAISTMLAAGFTSLAFALVSLFGVNTPFLIGEVVALLLPAVAYNMLVFKGQFDEPDDDAFPLDDPLEVSD